MRFGLNIIFSASFLSVLKEASGNCKAYTNEAKYLNCGQLSGEKAHQICLSGYGLPVIRSKNDLTSLQETIGTEGQDIKALLS